MCTILKLTRCRCEVANALYNIMDSSRIVNCFSPFLFMEFSKIFVCICILCCLCFTNVLDYFMIKTTCIEYHYRETYRIYQLYFNFVMSTMHSILDYYV